MIKKIIKILILFIILFGYCKNFAVAESGYIKYDEYNIYGYKFNPGDDINFFVKANKNFKKFESSKTKEDKNFYLQEAMRYYFLLSQIDDNSIDAHIGLGKVYDAMGIDNYAQEHFYKAYNINRNNPELNYCFGNYFYKRKNYIQALKYYKIAYKNLYSNNLELNIKLAIIYEKLADLEKSKLFYQKANQLSNGNAYFKSKIHLLDDLNYSNSQYYLFVK